MFATGHPSSVRQEVRKTVSGDSVLPTSISFRLHGPRGYRWKRHGANWSDFVRREDPFIGVSNSSGAPTPLLGGRASGLGQRLQNILHREIEHDLIPFCHTKNIAVLAYGPMAHGRYRDIFLDRLLPSDWRRRDHPLLIFRRTACRRLLQPLAAARGWTVRPIGDRPGLLPPGYHQRIGWRPYTSPNQASSEILRAGVDETVRAEVDRALDGPS